MSDTQPILAPAPAPVPHQDVFTQRVTTLTAAAAFMAGTGALIWVMVFGEPQMASIAMGFVGGTLVGGGGAYFMRGRVENPTQTRTGTGDGGQPPPANVTITDSGPTNVDTTPTVPAKPAPPVALGTPGTTTSTGVGVTPKPPTGGGMR